MHLALDLMFSFHNPNHGGIIFSVDKNLHFPFVDCYFVVVKCFSLFSFHFDKQINIDLIEFCSGLCLIILDSLIPIYLI